MAKLMPGASDEAREAAAAKEIPLGRMGRKWDIAMGVLFLASPAAGAVTPLHPTLTRSWCVMQGLRHRPLDA